MRRAFLAASILLLALRAGVAHAPPAPERATVLVIPGLSAPARIAVDRWGIPHVQAANLSDLYFAWGFATARDRLWQLEHTRRAASGELWEWFGNRSLTADGGAQLFQLRERAGMIWARERSDPAIREPLERYAAGINAWIARCRSGAEPWPEEFRRLKRYPGDWQPENAYLVLLAQAVLLDLDLPELDEAREIREHGLDWVENRLRYERDVTVPSIPDSVARRRYGRTTGAAVGLSPAAPAPARAAIPPALLAEARRMLAGLPVAITRDPDERASNVFAVGPKRSARGVPLLANDPHLGLTTPDPLYAVHLSVPGVVEAAGACVPGMPVIVSGRNPRVAWGITALGADVMDVYADTLSRDGKKVLWRGAWVPVREVPFTMRYHVLGMVPIPPLGQTRRYTPHGPVVSWDRKHGLALSLCWAGDDQAVTFGRLLGLMRAQSAADVGAAVRTLVQPTANIVAADRDGHVVYQACGALPRRGFAPGAGLLPDDGRHEWTGLIPPDELPRWELGPGDFVVNGNNLPVGAPYPDPFWRYHFMQDRAARMAQRLGGDRSMTLDDLRSVQNDLYSRGAERFVPRLLRCADSVRAALSPRARAAMDTLRAWDFMARRDRVGPTLFRAWLGALQRRSRLDGLPMLAAAALDGRAPGALRVPGGEVPERAAVAADSALELALSVLERRLGPDLSTWRWGRAHRARFRHAMAWMDSTLSTPPVSADGDNSTVCVGRSALPWSLEYTHAPVWRHVVDLAAPESSLCVLPPGNAGGGRHARDMLKRWANHGYVPLYLDWARIEAVTESDLRLEPAAGTTR